MITSIKELSSEEFELFRNDVEKAANILQAGGVIVYPTDTIWGIGCDASNEKAVSRIYEIKQRNDSKALITLVPKDNWIERYVEEVPDVAWDLLEASVDPLTIVYDKGKNIATNLLASDGSIGLRVCNELFCSTLCNRLKRPIVSTSANISGTPSPHNFNQISSEILSKVDYVVRWRRNDTNSSKASTVIKLGSGGLIKIIRS